MTQTQNKSAYRSGFVTIIGSPNVGKSTLMNRMVGQKISIVSDRAQTTRNRITGIVSRKDYQIIFLDTPGVTAPKNRLGEYMLKVAFDAVNEVEAILLMLDASVGNFLDEGCGTVGILLNAEHLAASPIGMHVRTESELTEIDGRVLTFSVRSYAGGELIGKGVHKRCIINSERFMAKALSKLDNEK